jgi:hypothetical protein
MDPTRTQWNKDGETAAQRLRDRGVRRFSAAEYEQEFLAVRQEREQKKQRAVHNYTGPRGDWRVYEQANGQIAELEFATGRSLTALGNLVAGLPRQSDGTIDAAMAVRVIDSDFRDLAQNAAGDFLSAVAMKLMRDQNVTAGDLTGSNSYGALFARMLNTARNRHQEIAAVYDGAPATETALRELLWPLFKTTTQRQDFEVRRYTFERA